MWILKRIEDIVFNHKGVSNPCDLINGSIRGVNDLRQMENESTKDGASMALQLPKFRTSNERKEFRAMRLQTCVADVTLTQVETVQFGNEADKAN